MLVGALLVHSAIALVYVCPLGSRLSPLEGGVTIVQLPYSLLSRALSIAGLASGLLGVRICRDRMRKELIDSSKSARGRPFYGRATPLRLLRIHGGSQSSH